MVDEVLESLAHEQGRRFHPGVGAAGRAIARSQAGGSTTGA